ncbi:MAG TPA: hypothetical protein VK983_05550 [Candidatus Limnocylindrales bacterium]|nr:hypothetical protein [Candidatus Limnocylindrales bacterium]
MNPFQTISYAIGPMMFWLGLGSTILFSIISYNEKKLALVELAISLALTLIGWIITKAVARSKGESVLYILLDLIP